MKRLISLYFSAILTFCILLSGYAEVYRMAGYDPATTAHDWSTNAFFRRMENVTGVSWRMQQFQDLAAWTKEKAQMKADNAELPDCIFKANLSLRETQDLYAKGVIIDLKPYLSTFAPHLSAILEKRPDIREAMTLPDGAIAALPLIDNLQHNNAMWINTRWLKTLNLEKPTNIDQLTKVLLAFRDRDPNVNGRSDEIPITFTGMWDLRFLQHAFGLIADEYGLTSVGTLGASSLVSVMRTEENRSFLEWLHMLWSEQLLDHSGFSAAGTFRTTSDEDASIRYGIVFGPTPLNMVSPSSLSDYELLMPLYDHGQQCYRKLQGDYTLGTFAITASCASPETLVSWVDYLYTEEGCYLARSGLVNQEYEWHSDGTWGWMDDLQTVTNVVLKQKTIADGTPMPGWIPASYSLAFDDAKIVDVVRQLEKLSEIAALPFPTIYLTTDEEAEINGIRQRLGPFLEDGMARFVTGDIELNDQNWSEWLQQADDLGMSTLCQVMNDALQRQQAE